MTNVQALAYAIVANGWYQEGNFLLSSGKRSDFYINLRPCLLSTRYLHLVTTCLLQQFERGTPVGEPPTEPGTIPKQLLEHKDLLCGVITSGLFLSGALLQRLATIREVDAIYVRTEHRGHGTKRDIEGEYESGRSVIVLDDVATSGRSLEKVIRRLVDHDLRVKAALVVVDRGEGANELLRAMGVPLYTCLTLADISAAKQQADNAA